MDFENHPIPQDVTGFKFKLVGSITLKQFIYLLIAGVFAYFFSAYPIHILLKIPLIFISLSIGFSLAFIPIEGRSMDKMIINFIKSIPSENEYIYRKTGVRIYAFEFVPRVVKEAKNPNQDLSKQAKIRKELLLSQIASPYSGMDAQEEVFLKNIKVFFDNTGSPAPRTENNFVRQQPVFPKNTEKNEDSIQKKNTSIEDEEAKLKKELEDAQKLQKEIGESEGLDRKIKELKKMLEETMSKRQELSRKQFGLGVGRVDLDETKKDNEPSLVKKIDPASIIAAGFPSIPDVPNVILGIVKDPRGKVLPNMIVEVLDKDNIPVRAFKTNALGQFASATQLPNGHYKIMFEDPAKRNGFDTIDIELKGEIFYPIEVTSIDARERLRRELFEGTN